MTTDNRTNEPTEAQVEAAVHAAWVKSREFRGVGGQAEFAPPWEFQQVIRAALVAAQGAAPQAESEYEHLLKARALHQTNAGLPSSAIDEDALAEVIEEARREWRTEWIVMQEREEPVPTPPDEWTARAVAEWLKEQGGESRGHS